MNIAEVIAKTVKIAENVAPLIVPGAGPAILAGKAVIDLIDDLKPEAPTNMDAAALAKARADLETMVNAHADSTIDRLAGEGD